MFNRLHSYTVHIKPSSKKPFESPLFVKEGFHWMAFVFGFIWAFYHRMWLAGFVILAVGIALGAVTEKLGITEFGIAIMQFAMQAIVAYVADELLRNKYRRDGYIVADIVSGESLPRAEQRFFERAVTAHAI